MQFDGHLNAIRHGLNTCPRLKQRAKRLTLRILLAAEEEGHVLHLQNGMITAIAPDRGPMHDWDVALRMARTDWERFWQPRPAPGWHDIFALTRSGRLQLEGNHLPLMQHLQVIKDILSLPRGNARGAA